MNTNKLRRHGGSTEFSPCLRVLYVQTDMCKVSLWMSARCDRPIRVSVDRNRHGAWVVTPLLLKTEQLPGPPSPYLARAVLLMEALMSSSSSACFVGIDVSNATLDVHLRPQAESWQIAYDSKHLAALIEKLQGLAPERLIVEATGGLETLLVSHLAAAAL